MGPWQLGRWYRPLAIVAVAGCAGLLVIGVSTFDAVTAIMVGSAFLALAAGWWLYFRRTFPGPPAALLAQAGALGE
jgi:hypothetical protein